MCCAPDRRGPGKRGFNLVEVALALGICSFAVVAILGLMSVGVTSSKASQRDTLVALAVKYVVSDLASLAYPPAAGNYYFDYHGTATNASGYYRCAVAVGGNPVPFAWAASSTNAVAVKLTFTWPGQTNTSGSNAKVFWTSVAAY